MNKFGCFVLTAAVALCAAVNSTLGEPPASDSTGATKPTEKGAAKDDHAGHDHAGHNHAGQDHSTRRAAPAANQTQKVSPNGHAGPVATKAKGTPQPVTPTVVLKPGEVPAIKFDTPTFNFGRVQSGTEVTHDFWFSNTGNGPLEILAVRPSCGCTTSGQHDRVVQPGESGKIPIRLSTGHGAGPMTKTIAVQTNVPGEGASVTLQVTGTLWQAVQAVPPNASYGSLRGSELTDKDRIRKVVITNNLDTPIKPASPKVTGGPFNAELRTLTEGKEYELIVTLKEPLPRGSHSGSIQVATGSEKVPMLNVPASVYVTADVEVSPAQLVVPPASTLAKPLDRMFYLRNYTNTPMAVKEIALSNSEVKAELTELQTGSAWRLTVTLPANHTCRHGEQMVIKTDSPNVPELVVPFMQASPELAAGTAGLPAASRRQATPGAAAGAAVGAPGDAAAAARKSGEAPGTSKD